MKKNLKSLATLAICLSFGLSGSVHAGDDNAELKAEARTIIKSFGMSLKSELIGAMKSGGPVKAMGVCNTKAQDITADASEKSKWHVARTSLKLRNPANEPDAWELKVLEDFEKKRAAGADPKTLEFSQITTYDDKKSFRFMKAIPTGGPCLACHGGSGVKPEVEALIKDLYPTDKARGFKAGDLRGAFSLAKPLE